MTIRPLVILPDARLRVVSEPVDRITDEIRRLADDMLETMYDAPGVGLAAIQIGVPKRVITMDVSKSETEPSDGKIVRDGPDRVGESFTFGSDDAPDRPASRRH